MTVEKAPSAGSGGVAPGAPRAGPTTREPAVVVLRMEDVSLWLLERVGDAASTSLYPGRPPGRDQSRGDHVAAGRELCAGQARLVARGRRRAKVLRAICSGFTRVIAGYPAALIPGDKGCWRHGISKLSLFGSELKRTARPDSDVDLLVEFEPGRKPVWLLSRRLGSAGRSRSSRLCESSD